MGEPKRKSVQENNRTPQEEKTRTTLREWLTKNWQTLLTTIFSLIAVGFSIGSCVVSNRANQLSQQAIETSTEQFFQENKPYIILKPIKYSKLQSYYKYTPLPEQNAVRIELQYQVRNIGRAGAKDLAVYDKLTVAKSSTQLKAASLDVPNKITLGPGEEYVLGMVSLIGWDNKESYDKYLQKLSTEKGPELTIRMGVTYLSEVNPKQSFSSAVDTKITKQRAQILKIEYNEE